MGHKRWSGGQLAAARRGGDDEELAPPKNLWVYLWVFENTWPTGNTYWKLCCNFAALVRHWVVGLPPLIMWNKIKQNCVIYRKKHGDNSNPYWPLLGFFFPSIRCQHWAEWHIAYRLCWRYWSQQANQHKGSILFYLVKRFNLILSEKIEKYDRHVHDNLYLLNDEPMSPVQCNMVAERLGDITWSSDRPGLLSICHMLFWSFGT
jgi:hypothetical protein